jgi:hypothetical protein
MLSKGGSHGGGVKRQPRFQKIVNTVADLPSALDTEPGTRIIVRESEEVFGLDKTTRMWSVIGTLKKVGGKLPEELADHVDSEGNPHKTTLQDIVGDGASVKVPKGVALSGKNKADQLRIMSGDTVLRVGLDAGNKEGLLWVNAGNGAQTVLRVVGGKGSDLFVVSGDGSLKSSGAAQFAGGFKGPAAFDDEITASEGLYGAKGHDLVLGADKGTIFMVGKQIKAQLTSSGLNLSGSLDVKNHLSVGGTVRSSLNPNPSRSLTLGVPLSRWKSAALVDLDISGGAVFQIASNSKQSPLKILGSAPGNSLIVSPTGQLGLGTESPEGRLDVRGDILVGDGTSRLKLTSGEITGGSWGAVFGDEFVLRDGDSARLRVNDDGTTIFGGAKVQGDLIVLGQISIDGISGHADESMTFSNGATSYKARSHTFSGAVRVSSDTSTPFEVAGGFASTDGDLVGVGGALKKWSSLTVKKFVSVADTGYRSGSISHPVDFAIDAPVLVTNNLQLLKSPKIEVSNTLRLQGAGGSATFSMGGPNCGLSFEGKSWELLGVSKLDAGEVKAKALGVAGGASFCDDKVVFEKSGVHLSCDLAVGGLVFKSHTEELDLSKGNSTSFEIPAGVRVEAVMVKLVTDVGGVRFLMVGDTADPNRFSGPSTDLAGGALIYGMDHWAQSRMVQKSKAPIIVSGDAPASGIVSVTIHYVDPAAL